MRGGAAGDPCPDPFDRGAYRCGYHDTDADLLCQGCQGDHPRRGLPDPAILHRTVCGGRRPGADRCTGDDRGIYRQAVRRQHPGDGLHRAVDLRGGQFGS